MIGPKNILSFSLEYYRINSDMTLECLDSFDNFAQLKDDSSTTQNFINTPNLDKNQSKMKQVRFNLDVVKCQFAKQEPATTISKQTKKLMSLNPNLTWLNPSFNIMKRK